MKRLESILLILATISIFAIMGCSGGGSSGGSSDASSSLTTSTDPNQPVSADPNLPVVTIASALNITSANAPIYFVLFRPSLEPV